MNITLTEYIKLFSPPKLSYHFKYKQRFEKQYQRLKEELIGVLDHEKGIRFFCWKSEFTEFNELCTNGKLTYKDSVIDLNHNTEFLFDFSKEFEQGFNAISDQSPKNTTLNNVPICLHDMCLCQEGKGENRHSIRTGRANSQSRLCIAGVRPVTVESLSGNGILRIKSINYETGERVLAIPRKNAFNDGIMFRSIFTVIERYAEFDEYFLDHDSNLIETKTLLTKYPKVKRLFEGALAKINLEGSERNAVDDLRLGLELLLKELLHNDKSIENQLSILGDFLKEKGTSKELVNMLKAFLDYYLKYQNNYVKHNDNIKKQEVDVILDLSVTFMKHLIRLSQ
jgi:hypothetical protein